MKKIAIDELLDMVDSRYSLVTIISKRARQIIDGQDILIRTPTRKPVAIAIEEFYGRAFEEVHNIELTDTSLPDTDIKENTDKAEI
ncbi:MAG: DNA-directed polymerase subunit omega [Bacillota bacterium]|jgi:DNA-directed RNA polymerase subunit omega|nr:DNA-directed polymerase subunit omega [Bacillota bacterium]